MQDVEILLARTVSFIDMAALNPTGLAFGPIHAAFRERYNFLIYPTRPEQFDSTAGIVYKSGTFEFEGKNISVEMTLYGNGWLVDTHMSTEASDAFSQDLLNWLRSTYALKTEKAVSRIVHESQLGFRSEVDLTKIKELRRFTKLLAGATKDISYEAWAFLFQGDNSNSGNPAFTFERRANVPFKERKYFSKAPLPTKVHLELIPEFEKIFT